MEFFEKFNDYLWIAKGEYFVASLELKNFDAAPSRYDIEGWHLVAREKNNTRGNLLGVFVPIKQKHDPYFSAELCAGVTREETEASVARHGVDRLLWNDVNIIIVRARQLLEALGYN